MWRARARAVGGRWGGWVGSGPCDGVPLGGARAVHHRRRRGPHALPTPRARALEPPPAPRPGAPAAGWLSADGPPARRPAGLNQVSPPRKPRDARAACLPRGRAPDKGPQGPATERRGRWHAAGHGGGSAGPALAALGLGLPRVRAVTAVHPGSRRGGRWWRFCMSGLHIHSVTPHTNVGACAGQPGRDGWADRLGPPTTGRAAGRTR